MSVTERKYNVIVLSRGSEMTFLKVGEPIIIKLITYVAAGLPPHTVRIPKDKWTIELERTAIKDSIQSRLAKRPESYRV